MDWDGPVVLVARFTPTEDTPETGPWIAVRFDDVHHAEEWLDEIDPGRVWISHDQVLALQGRDWSAAFAGDLRSPQAAE